MTNFDMKKKVLALIEELNPDSELLTDDPDIATKINEVTNQVMFELVRFKKIPKYVEIDVAAGDLLTFEDIAKEVGYDVYHLGKVGGVNYESKASGTVLKFMESGTAEIECFIFPDRIEANTRDKAYEFELSADVLEIMPYGIAADLLKSDVSAEYGKVYAERYESMKQLLDPRYQMTTIRFEGGYRI